MSNTFDITPRTADALAWADLLQDLSRRCHTDQGRAAALQLPFLADASEVEQEQQRVAEARALHDRGDPMPFGSVFDLRMDLRRLQKDGVLDGPTLLQVAQTIQAGARLRGFLLGRSDSCPALAAVAGRLEPLTDVSGPILDSFDEHGVLTDHASAELGRLRRRRADLHERLCRRMRRLMDDPGITKFLQDRFYTQREDRFVLPIRSDSGSAVKGIVHGASASGATLFVEPQDAVGLNNELKVAEMEVLREEARIYADLSGLVAEVWQAVWDNLERLCQLDVVNARARQAVDLDAHPVQVSDARVQLNRMRHPLMLLGHKQVVPNDLCLEPGQTLVISGPNAGGKTVCLKTLGLCALMQRAGMHLPVGPDSQMPLFDTVLTEMGDDQSIEHSLSTFTAHLSHLLSFLQAADARALILLDEIAVGTDPNEGAALAQALLESFADAEARVVVTTHYERLKMLPLGDERFVNASVGVDPERGEPTYRLHSGLPGTSGALAVARRVGLPEAIASRAQTLLQGGSQELSAVLERLARQSEQLDAEREQLQRATEDAQRLARQREQELTRFKEQQQRQLDAEFHRALEELKRARLDLERVRTQLRRKPDSKQASQADREVSGAARTILRHEPSQPPAGRPAEAAELRPGVTVLVTRLGGTGKVLEPPVRGKVTVQVGGLRTQVPLKQVLIPSGRAGAQASRQRRTGPKTTPPATSPPAAPSPADDGADAPSLLRAVSNTLDLRGTRVHEALAMVDKALDDALRSGEEGLFVIHGHGTGALRSALREHLPTHPLVDRFEPAPPREGGDGVTVIWLR